MRASLALIALLLASHFAFAGELLVVDQAHPAGTFADIQSAVNAAADDDAILVRAGVYPRFAIVDKALSVVAEAGADVLVADGASVTSTMPSATRSVTLTGLRIHGAFQPIASPTALVLMNLAGSVRIEDCELLAAPGTQDFCTPHEAVRVLSCADVALTRCFVRGEGPASLPTNFARGGAGVLATSSKLALYDSTIFGGNGGSAVACSQIDVANDLNCNYGYACCGDGADGGPACKLINTEFVASRCVLRGGNGGDAGPDPWTVPFVGACGGAGVYVQSGGVVWGLTTTPEGGLRGADYPPFNPQVPAAGVFPSAGAFHAFPGDARSLDADALVREAMPIHVHAEGSPGDRLGLFVSFESAHVLELPFQGVQLVRSPPGGRFLRVGALDANGFLDTTLPAPELGAGIEARTLHVQSVHQSPSGTTVLGPVRSIVIVDRAL